MIAININLVLSIIDKLLTIAVKRAEVATPEELMALNRRIDGFYDLLDHLIADFKKLTGADHS